MKVLLIALTISLLAGCGSSGSNGGGDGRTYPLYGSATTPPTHPDVIKETTQIHRGTEGSPFIWNGQLLYITSSHAFGTGVNFWIADYFSHAVIAEVQSEMSFLSPYVEDGVLYVFGKVGDDIARIESTDLVTFTDPVTVLVDPEFNYILNPHVIKDGAEYLMVYEGWGDGIVRFARSNDLTTWIKLPFDFNNDNYAGGPSLHLKDGYYYIHYLVVAGEFWYVDVARSTDLATWEYNSKPFAAFTPLYWEPTEAYNNSDADFVEYGGNTYFIYYVGDQVLWTDMKKASYIGTDYLTSFFN